MSFEKFLWDDMDSGDFGASAYAKSFKERQNISKIEIDAGLGGRYLDVGATCKLAYSNPGVKYVCATQLSFDLLFTLYEVNSRVLLAARFTDFTEPIARFFEKEMHMLKGKNFEARLIGMQSGDSVARLTAVLTFVRKSKIGLFEIDLFGADTRNVCVDAKTGASFDILMNNRLYKPGELKNTMTSVQFERGLQTQQQPAQPTKH